MDIRGGLSGIVGGFWSGSSTSSISSFLHLIQTPYIFSRNVRFSLLELQPHFILGPSFGLWCLFGRGSRSWGIGGGGLIQPMVFSFSASLNLFSTSGVILRVFGCLGGVRGGGVFLEVRSLTFTSFFNTEQSPTLRRVVPPVPNRTGCLRSPPASP